ncbi:nucleotidyltransferase-like protein [Lentibacillus juripiscarius]|uniref:Nucleotidyltransferase-like protein n=1 Tax=Lentibacillus juripiscarius TaxID=257446 RepID=A0ABW5V476_9BACI
MEKLFKPIYEEQANHTNTLGIILIEKTKPDSPITDNFDVIMLVVVKASDADWHEKHYEFYGKTAAMLTLTERSLNKWIDTNGNRKAVEWILAGKVVFDRDEYISNLKDQLRRFPHEKRDLRKTMEFGKLLKSYSEVKDLYASEQYKDAFSRMVHTLHYLARLAVVEEGYHPEATLWSQVKETDPEIYKLYDELIESDEPIAKRIQLMILAADFAISRRAKVSAKHLLDIMDERTEAWSCEELKDHPKIASYAVDLTAILHYLTEKGILVTEKSETKVAGVYRRRYRINQE